MSRRVRRMALGLATLTLLASLFMAVQGFVDPPDQALAACEVMVDCTPYYRVEIPICCCYCESYMTRLERTCWKINLDCSVDYWVEIFPGSYNCRGGYCTCP